MGATLLDGVVVEKHAMVAAGALVRQNSRIPTGEVCVCVCFFLILYSHFIYIP
jgi:carbonic anhydrase/acetyltransferase-like protein (isoleucine patch superfamily)